MNEGYYLIKVEKLTIKDFFKPTSKKKNELDYFDWRINRIIIVKKVEDPKQFQ